MEWEEGCQAWLREFDLWDPTHTEQWAHRRYLTFSHIQFSTTPREVWAKLVRDLLEFEPSLVFGPGRIGLVDMPFSFRIFAECPIREHPIAYPKGKQAWLHCYCKE